MIINEVEKIVREACAKENNVFKYALDRHFVPVVMNARKLAQKLGADEEIVVIAAWLHDYASVYDKNLVAEHQIHSQRLAEEILNKLNYPKDRIEKVKYCISTHRGSGKIAPETIEAKCVASADAMAHISEFGSLLILAWVIHKKDYDEGVDWALAKMERSWKKIMPEAKELVADKYQAIKTVFGK